MSKIRYLFSLLILLIIFSCGSDSQGEKNENILDIALTKEPAGLNPYVIATSNAREVYQYIFVPVADFDPVTYELTPILVKEIPKLEPITSGEFEGGYQYTFEFKDDAVWDDGSPITGEDYVFSVKAVKHPLTSTAGYSGYFQWISDIKIDSLNPRKFSVLFKEHYMLSKELASTIEVYPRYIYDPSNALTSIRISDLDAGNIDELISKNESLKTFAEDFNSIKFSRDNISNCGPYKLKEWIASQSITLEKKEDYWGKKYPDIEALHAGADEIIFHFIADEAAIMSQLKEGNLDVYNEVSAESFFDLKTNMTYDEKFQFFTPELMKFYYVALNNTSPEISDPNVRKALAKLVDVEQLIKIQEKGLGRQTVGFINEKKPYYNSTLEPIAHDVEGAKEILAEQGWEDTNYNGTIDKKVGNQLVEMELDMYITGSDLSKSIALLLKENAKKAGITINIIQKQYKDIRDSHLKTGDYDMTILSINQDLTLDDPYGKWHSENATPGNRNYYRYISERSDEIIDSIRSTKDDATRNRLYLELQAEMYKDQPVIFLYNPVEKLIVSDEWKATATMKRPGYMANTFTLK